MIKLIYIDDDIDTLLSEYLDSVGNKILLDEIDYEDVYFSDFGSYEKLLESEKVKTANVIIIDSRLFEESTIDSDVGAFSGEEFKLILNKINPFIEIIIISQNDDLEGVGIISKYKSRDNSEEPSIYYDKKLLEPLKKSMSRVLINRTLLKKLKKNTSIDVYLVEQIEMRLDGMLEYNDITTDDIDRLITEFKTIMDENCDE